MNRSKRRPLWLWSYGNWIYNYMCNRCPSPLKLWVRIPLMVRCTQYNFIKFVSDLSVVFSTNKPDHHDITEILLKVVLNTITINNNTQSKRPSSKKLVDLVCSKTVRYTHKCLIINHQKWSDYYRNVRNSV
jgi:hypothetical protein